MLRFDRGAGKRRVHHAYTLERQILGDAQRRARLAGGGIDHYLAAATRLEYPTLAIDQILDLRGAGDAEDDDIRVADEAGNIPGLLRATPHQVLNGLPVPMP